MMGRKPDRANYFYGARQRNAEALATSSDCVARTPFELEISLQCDLTSQLYAGPEKLSGAVMEKSLQFFLRDYELQYGELTDPIEHDLLVSFFLLKHRTNGVFGIMAKDGQSGYKTMGPLVTRLQRELAALGEKLQAMRQARTVRVVERDDDVGTDETFEQEEAEYRHEQAREFAEHESMRCREAAQVMADLPPEERQRLIQEELDAREKQRLAHEALGVHSAADVARRDEKRGRSDMTQGILRVVPGGSSRPVPRHRPGKQKKAPLDPSVSPASPACETAGPTQRGDSTAHDVASPLPDVEPGSSIPPSDDAAPTNVGADVFVDASPKSRRKRLAEEKRRMSETIKQIRQRQDVDRGPTNREEE